MLTAIAVISTSKMPYLMDLPSEIRIQILGYAVLEQIVVEMPSPTPIPSNPALPLLLVNSTINAEATLLPKPVLVIRFRPDTDVTSSVDFNDWIILPRSYRASFMHQVEIYDSCVYTVVGDNLTRQWYATFKNCKAHKDKRTTGSTMVLLMVFHNVKLLVSEYSGRFNGDLYHAEGLRRWEVSRAK